MGNGLWRKLLMDKILHHFESRGSQYLLVFAAGISTESSFQGFLGGAGFSPQREIGEYG